MNYRFWWYSL